MGNPANVAFRNADGTYDLYRSPDGATNFQLLAPLSFVADADDPSYRDFVAALKAPEASLDTEGGLDHHFARQRAENGLTDFGDGDPATLLEEDPVATNIAAGTLLEELHPDVQHLYVVDDGLDLYYPAWGSIGLMAWFQQHARISAYDRDRVPSPAQVDALVDRDPDHTWVGDDFADLPQATPTTEWYQLFRDHFQQLGAKTLRDTFEYDLADEAVETVRMVTPEWVFVVDPVADTLPTPETVSAAMYPIHIPLDGQADLDAVATEVQAVREAVSDLALYVDGMLLATDMPVSQEAIRANAGEMFIENLQQEFGKQLDDTFLPFDTTAATPNNR